MKRRTTPSLAHSFLRAAFVLAGAWLLPLAAPPSTVALSEKAYNLVLKQGDPAPEFDVTALDGSRFTTADLKGKAVVLNFWFIACPPCREEIPRLNQLVEHFRDQPVVFIGLAADPPPLLTVFLKKNPFRYHVVPSATSIANRFGIDGAPTHVILDTQGRVVHFVRGVVKDVGMELRPWIERALAGSE